MAENRYGAMGIAVGILLYFVSFTVAKQTKLDWLVVGIKFVGFLAGLFLTLFTVVDAVDKGGDWPFMVYVLFILVASLSCFLAFGRFKRRNPHA